MSFLPKRAFSLRQVVFSLMAVDLTTRGRLHLTTSLHVTKQALPLQTLPPHILNKSKIAKMDRRRRASSVTSKGLSKQLASIADTLAKASQRRDAEVKKLLLPSKTSTQGTGHALPSKPALPAPVNDPDRDSSKTPSPQLDSGTSTTSESRAGNDRKVSLTTSESRCIRFSRNGT